MAVETFSPPTWSPNVDEVYENWKGRLISSGLVIWDRFDEIDEHVARSIGTGDGVKIDEDLDFLLINSSSDLEPLLLPKIEDVGVGKFLRLFVKSTNGFRLRTQEDFSTFINGKVCSKTNELFIPGRCSAFCSSVSSTEWEVVGWNDEGETLELIPVTWGSTSVIDSNGNQSITATSGGATLSEGVKHATVSSSTSTHIVNLPTPKVGREVTGYVGSTGFALAAQSPEGTSNDVKINNVVCTGGSAEAAIPATTYWTAKCISSSEWILLAYTELGADVTAIVPS